MSQSNGNGPAQSCQRCGTTFRLNRWWQAYCSQTCQWQAWNQRHPRQGIRRRVNVRHKRPTGAVVDPVTNDEHTR